ncbi:MAG: dihydrolipoamide dehydrogenase, partial [Candidatus Marinamargulisbacteria bacterium]
HMVIIGGGVIGVEMGSIFARLGSQVSVVEFMDNIIPTMDKELGSALKRSLSKIGMSFHVSTKVTAVTPGKTVHVTAESKQGNPLELDCDVVLVAVGRRPYTDTLGLDKAGIKTDKRGFIQIDKNFTTSAPNVFAIGDVVGGWQLAHKASEEGVACVELIHGEKPQLNYLTIPSVIYTWPEVASVGFTEAQLKAENREFKKGKFPFKASGRARAAEESEGFIKVLSDKNTDEILGIHMIGPRASDMITSGIIAMEFKASAEDIGAMMHPHPSYTEALKEAALMASGNRAIHI